MSLSRTVMQLLHLLRRIGVSLLAMRASLPLSVQPHDLRRFDVLPAYPAVVPKSHFTHMERLAA